MLSKSKTIPVGELSVRSANRARGKVATWRCGKLSVRFPHRLPRSFPALRATSVLAGAVARARSDRSLGNRKRQICILRLARLVPGPSYEVEIPLVNESVKAL